MKIPIIDFCVTSRCNNSCIYCYAGGLPDAPDYDDIIEHIAKLTDSVCITGGEPLILPSRTIDIIKKLKQNGVKNIHLSTSGVNYLDYEKEIAPEICKLSLPLDGFDSISNAALGRGLNDFDNVIKILDYYKTNEPSFDIKISTVLTKQNLDATHFAKMFELLKNYPVSMWKIYEVMPQNRGAVNFEELKMSKAEFDDFKHELNSVVGGSLEVRALSSRERSDCYLIVEPNGDMAVPSQRAGGFIENNFLGNILDKSTAEILQGYETAADKNKLSNILKTRGKYLKINEKEQNF